MRIEIKRRGVVIGCCALFAMAGIAVPPTAYGAYLSDNFESDTADVVPTSVTGTASGPTYEVKVVNSTTTPTDPFAASGNQSLMLRDQDGSVSSAAWWTGASGGLQSGNFSTQFQLDPVLSTASPDQPYAYTVIALGNDLSSGGAGIGGSAAAMVDIISYDGASPGSIRPNLNASPTSTVALGVVHTLTIHFDVGTKTYSVTLDGTPLTDGSNNNVFPFYQDVPNVDSVAVAAGWSSTNGVQVFYDNLNLSAVPEPASLALLGLSVAALMLKRRV